MWQQWGSWSSCSKSCGSGQKSRQRSCTPPRNGGLPCQGNGNENTICNTSPCPINSIVSAWSTWSSCSKSCGTGKQTRERTCIAEAQHGGASCESRGLTGSKPCNTNACPQDAVLSAWSQWDECTVSCGGGTQSRQRTCTQQGQNGGRQCEEFDLTETQDCGTEACPIRGALSEWTGWSVCSVTCGEGQQERTRTCIPPQHGGEPCPSSNLQENKPCSASVACPINGTLSAWSEWTACSNTCGGGNKTRSRTCTSAQNGGHDCGESLLNQTQSCSTGIECPIDGEWRLWSDWACSVSCGVGVKERHRTCIGPFHGGLPCAGDDHQSQPCQASTTNCPVNGIEGQWGAWSACSSSCRRGTRSRQRSCAPPQFGGKDCGDLEEVQVCSNRCPTDGIPLHWSNWGTCSVTCGNGMHSRSRTCSEPLFGGKPCNVPLTESKPCTGLLLSCDKTYNDWQSWGPCSQSCGPDGERIRRRTCTGRALCDGVDITERQICNTEIICPVDGFYNNWENWSACSVTCGSGLKRRTRTCVPPVGTGRPCSGPASQDRECTINCAGEYYYNYYYY